jgi:hypothetical protein
MDSKIKLGMENLETKQSMAGWITKETKAWIRSVM